jgi:murein DD-endopeptidase MepM/ murein hydrolase activator NlpD
MRIRNRKNIHTFSLNILFCLCLLCSPPAISLFTGSAFAQAVTDAIPYAENPIDMFSFAPPQKEESTEIITIEKGDTLISILESAGLCQTDADEACSTAKDLFDGAQLREGQVVKIIYGPEHGFRTLSYAIDGASCLIISRAGYTFRSTVRNIPRETDARLVGGVVDTSLFSAVEEIGETPQLASELAQIFAWDIDFFKDLRRGDTFRAIVEKEYQEGDFSGYGKLLAAEFVNQGTTYRAFYYEDSEGHGDYYAEDGRSLRKQFLKVPLRYTRISSGFSYHRFHPILKTVKPHQAVDYAAPYGTPVYAIADGTVEFCGYDGPAGNSVRIRHNSVYESVYRHLSSFGSGIRTGVSVSQGRVIGYVGQTGRTTGPHLCFSLHKNGVWVNPLTMHYPPASPVSDENYQDFAAKRDALLVRLNAFKPLRPLEERMASVPDGSPASLE